MGNIKSFFKSEWATMRASAVMFVGFLLGNLDKENRKLITVDHVCRELIGMLKDSDAGVRKRTAETIALLYEF